MRLGVTAGVLFLICHHCDLWCSSWDVGRSWQQSRDVAPHVQQKVMNLMDKMCSSFSVMSTLLFEWKLIWFGFFSVQCKLAFRWRESVWWSVNYSHEHCYTLSHKVWHSGFPTLRCSCSQSYLPFCMMHMQESSSWRREGRVVAAFLLYATVAVVF
jgi:hypothetical protein